MITDGWVTHIKLLGIYVWHNEDDGRPYLYSVDEDTLDETLIITPAGEEARIDMKGWLMGRMTGVQSLIGEFIKGEE